MSDIKKGNIVGILAEFDNPTELMDAAHKVHDAKFKKFDCHSPFPIHGMDKAMGLKRSPLGWSRFPAFFTVHPQRMLVSTSCKG